MKKKALYTFLLTIVLCLALAVISSATYYVDKNGEIADSTSNNLAYEFDVSVDNKGNKSLFAIYLYDSSITTIVLPDFEDISKLYIADWSKALKIYDVQNKGKELTAEMELQAQIKVFDTYEHISVDGANKIMGSFMNWSGLEKLIFRSAFSYGTKEGMFFGCNNLSEMHFYGQNIKVPTYFTNVLKYNLERKGLIVFHEGSTGTLSTGYDTLPTVSNLQNNFAIIINPNITPSNPDDTRLGAQWGQTTSTTGWELIVAVSNKNSYTAEQLEALKTSHTFCSRANSVANAIVKEATVMTYCELGYSAHNEQNVYEYKNGYASDGTLTTGCANGCGLSTEIALAPIISFLGYSAKIDGNEICVGYSLNKDALDTLEGNAGITLDYGVVAIIPVDESEYTPLYVDNGVVKSIDYSIHTSVARAYASFDFVIRGFTSDYYDTELVMCAYVYDGSELGYLCVTENGSGEAEFTQSNTASTITFNGVL